MTSPKRDKPITVLGIESSCDDSAAAIVTENRQILANIVTSQLAEHQPYGGVVPEISSRSHLQNLPHTIRTAMDNAGASWDDITAIAVTAGPGLIGGVLVGSMMAKAIAAALNKPIIAVNHLEGHALTARLTNDVQFPFILLLVSGGHCQILEALSVGHYRLLGQTVDDSIGETFDKVARGLGLGYPGGPAIERFARVGNPYKFDLPKPFSNDKGHCNFSLSGLKTAAKRLIDSIQPLTQQDIADICASFQESIVQIIISRVEVAIKRRLSSSHENRLVIAGGVAANQSIRARLSKHIEKHSYQLVAPPLNLCTDNAAMIAWVGVERLQLGLVDELTFQPRSRWAL
ncbi:MAG: tRNA (adenosine(37)-N6)-threonylcarbamoyltransferase complex transferase subunit TsaD [Proteobacteria bacterium]|nr:tRNA (adenosine(37)-N6)-threonylcarbamoyltransferase complex transferase subunit TsaD [Pseudomonadota bacterium]